MAKASFTRQELPPPPASFLLELSEDEAFELVAILGAQCGVGILIFNALSESLKQALTRSFTEIQSDGRYQRTINKMMRRGGC